MKHVVKLFLSLLVILTMTIGNTYAICSVHPTQITETNFQSKTHSSSIYTCISNHDKPIIECDNEIEDDNDEVILNDTYTKPLYLTIPYSEIFSNSESHPIHLASLNILYCVFRL